MHFLDCVHKSPHADFGTQAVGALEFECSLPNPFELTGLIVDTDAAEDVSDLRQPGPTSSLSRGFTMSSALKSKCV